MEDYNCHAGSIKQASYFEISTKLITNHAQENFDIGKEIDEALRTMSGPNTDEWRPTMQASTSNDEPARDSESGEFELN